MNCTYCGTALPADAMFCGECGRSVVVTAARTAAAARVPASPPAAREPGPAFLSTTAPPEQPSAATHAAANDTAANDTAVIEPVPVEWPVPVSVSVSAPVSVPAPAQEQEQEPEPEPSPEPAPASPSTSPRSEDLYDLEATRIVRSGRTGVRFVLQFSTGESHAVFGTGLIGRNPVAEPGEYFDQHIAISDPGKSVSKTHLEFGQSGGEFWIMDRFSGNGTVVRQAEAPANRCDGGKRYIVPRGARIDIGEQFFVVS